MLKSLEQKGYVTRSRSAEDERLLIAAVTDEGMALRERAADVPARVSGCVKLDTEEAVQLYGLLYKLLDSISE